MLLDQAVMIQLFSRSAVGLWSLVYTSRSEARRDSQSFVKSPRWPHRDRSKIQFSGVGESFRADRPLGAANVVASREEKDSAVTLSARPRCEMLL